MEAVCFSEILVRIYHGRFEFLTLVLVESSLLGCYAVNSALKPDTFPVQLLFLLANNGKPVMLQTKQDKAYSVWL
jgi:hypothetical protein